MLPITAMLAYVSADTWFPVAATNSTPLGGGGSAAADLLRAFPAPVLSSVGCGRVIDEVGVMVQTAALNEEVRIGLYLDDGNGYPGDLLVDFGAMSVSSVGKKTLAASEGIDCGAGPLWAAIWQSSGSKLVGMPPSSFGPALGTLSTFTTELVVGWESSQGYTPGTSVLPATYPTGAAKLTHNTGFVPTFFVHFD